MKEKRLASTFCLLPCSLGSMIPDLRICNKLKNFVAIRDRSFSIASVALG